MAEASNFVAKKRYAVVTGANKGIGLEICRQLASQGVVVILTSRDGKRGLEALENLKKSGIDSENLHYHQLDVTNTSSIASLAGFINSKLGKLDILVNNAGISGVMVNFDALKAAGSGTTNYAEMITQTNELAEECLETNYYGAKRAIEALVPLLELSDSPRIVNVSSALGKLKNIPIERIKGLLSDSDKLTEEKIDEILNEFLRDFQGWFTQREGLAFFNGSLYRIKSSSECIYNNIGEEIPVDHHQLCLSWLCQNRYQRKHGTLISGRRCSKSGEASVDASWFTFRPILCQN